MSREGLNIGENSRGEERIPGVDKLTGMDYKNMSF